MQNQEEPTGFTFLKLITAKWATQLISAAAELGVADALKDGPLSVAELAARTGSDPAMLYRLMRALSSLGLFKETEEHGFVMLPLGEPLRRDTPGSMRALSMMCARPWHNRGWEKLAESVRTGTPASELAFGKTLWAHLDENPADLENFNEAMAAASSTMHATAVDAYDFSGIEVLVDVGGGYGRLLGLILQKYPAMRGVVFDRPHVEPGARAELDRLGVGERSKFVGGDFLTAVAPGGDAYMMSHILHDWPDHDALKILKNCRQVMQPGKKVLALDAVVKPANEPDWGKLMDVEISVLFGGRDRTEAELRTLFEQAGFTLTRVIATQSTVSVVEGVAK